MPETPPWWVVLMTAVSPVIIGTWTFLQWWAGRADKNKDRDQTARASREETAARERAALTADTATYIDRVEADLERARADLERARAAMAAVEADRDRGWALGRRWNDKSWHLRHQAIHARQLAESAMRLAGEPTPAWPEHLELPDFEEILQDKGQPYSRSKP